MLLLNGRRCRFRERTTKCLPTVSVEVVVKKIDSCLPVCLMMEDGQMARQEKGEWQEEGYAANVKIVRVCCVLTK